jgi:hypothetical protein
LSDFVRRRILAQLCTSTCPQQPVPSLTKIRPAGADAFPDGRGTDRRGRRHLAEQGTATPRRPANTCCIAIHCHNDRRFNREKYTEAEKRFGVTRRRRRNVGADSGKAYGIMWGGGGAERLPNWGTFGKAPTLPAFLTNANGTADLHNHISKTQK